MGIESHTPDCSKERTCRISDLYKKAEGTREKMEEETLIFIEATKFFSME
ncbi:hypothetical protein MSLAZ_0118 [Methanosarcina lacustris Z-7289]|uniref:Uncharacterized protein n=1 Tax=Methanosarcina lacustris Z-7289 TaxID=1434111 RepID=A0A0E3RYS1_9EURY|nr:hypothetical protein [Methanosarcina lacustris]AKB73379.1 hypothetical protein MSLAZ_0118 [Methanosarcina lacustris Z-7289]